MISKQKILDIVTMFNHAGIMPTYSQIYDVSQSWSTYHYLNELIADYEIEKRGTHYSILDSAFWKEYYEFKDRTGVR